MYPEIVVDGRMYDVSILSTEIVELLERHYGHPKTIACTCHPEAYLNVVFHADEDWYGLARYARTAHLHKPGCKFGRDWWLRQAEASDGDANPKFRVKNGRHQFRVKGALVRRATATTPGSQQRSSTGTTSGRAHPAPSMWTQMGLYWFHAAGLFHHSPAGPMDWAGAANALGHVVATTDINGRPAADVVTIASNDQVGRVEAHVARLREATTETHVPRGIVLGVVRSVECIGDDRYRLLLDGASTPFDIDEVTWARIRRSRWSANANYAFSRLKEGDRHGCLVLLGLFEANTEGGATIVGGGCFVTTDSGMPVQSQGELYTAIWLMGSGHRFFKPISFFKRVRDYEPDFVVFLGYELLYLEVAGFHTEKYIVHTLAKTSVYLFSGANVWVWWVNLRLGRPALEPQDPATVIAQGRALLERAVARRRKKEATRDDSVAIAGTQL